MVFLKSENIFKLGQYSLRGDIERLYWFCSNQDSHSDPQVKRYLIPAVLSPLKNQSLLFSPS